LSAVPSISPARSTSRTADATGSGEHLVLLLTYLGTLVAYGVMIAAGVLFMSDDIFFYLKIADALYQGEGSTFNGIQPTNGYHPLWMLVCVISRAIAGSDPYTLVRVLFGFSLVGTLISIALAQRLAKALDLSRLAVAPAVIAAYLTFNPIGSEIHVSAPLLLATVLQARRVLSGPSDDRAAQLRLGALLGLATLARLDNVFVLALIGALALLPLRGSIVSALRRGVTIAAPAALLIAPYLAWNLIVFGHLVPISGAIKFGLAQSIGWNPAKIGTQHWLLNVGVVAAPLFWYLRGRRTNDYTLFAFSTGALIHAIYVLLRMEAIWTWYFAGEVIAVAFMLDAATRSVMSLGSVRILRVAAAVAVGLLMPMIAVRQATIPPLPARPWFLETASWIDANVPEGEAIAVTHSPGAVAYFSRRSVMALDGLTGDYAFHERAGRDGLYTALHGMGVRYLLAPGPRLREFPEAFRRTEAIGHTGEGASFRGTIGADGLGTVSAIGLYSAIEGRNVGWLRTDDSNLVDQGFCSREIAVWKLAPADPMEASLPPTGNSLVERH
jgi:hypothetical protein